MRNHRASGGFTHRISRGSHSRSLVRTRAAFGLAAVLALASSLTTKAACVFDNMSNVLNTNLSAVTGTGSTPNFFMGDGYLLLPGVTNITGFDLFPGNLTGTNFTGIEINIYVWQNVNLSGTVNATTPAFSNLLAAYTATSSGAFNTGFFYIFEGSPAGVNPGFTLGTPLAISGTNIGITFNYQGTYDGVNYFNSNLLYEIIAYGAPPTVGGQNFNGYYRNASGETNGNLFPAFEASDLPTRRWACECSAT